jgi:hypothetical protein
MNRREFLGLMIGTAACATAPVLLAGTPPNDKLDQVCWQIGKFSRERNLQPVRVIATDQWGHLVLTAKTGDLKEDGGSFHIADCDLNYTQLKYRVEHRYLERASELSVFVRTDNECHSFPLVFVPRDRHA